MNFFPKDSNNNIAKMMDEFPIESNTVWHVTDSKKAVAVYFSLQYYFATTNSTIYKKGYAYLSEMAGCSVRWLTPTLRLLAVQNLIKLDIINNWNNKVAVVTNIDNSVVNTKAIQERIQELLQTKYSPNFSTYFRSKCMLSRTDSDIYTLSCVEGKEEQTHRRIVDADPPLVAYAAAASTEPALPRALWGNQDPTEIHKFFNALKTELRKYDSQQVEKLINASLNSIKYLTSINDLTAYLTTVKKNILTKLARSSNKKGEVAVMPINDENKKAISTPEVREMTFVEINGLKKEGRSNLHALMERLDQESGI